MSIRFDLPRSCLQHHHIRHHTVFFSAVLVDVAVCKLSLWLLFCRALYAKMLSGGLCYEMDGALMQLSLITCWSKAPEIESAWNQIPSLTLCFSTVHARPRVPSCLQPRGNRVSTRHRPWEVRGPHPTIFTICTLCDVSGSYVTIPSESFLLCSTFLSWICWICLFRNLVFL